MSRKSWLFTIPLVTACFSDAVTMPLAEDSTGAADSSAATTADESTSGAADSTTSGADSTTSGGCPTGELGCPCAPGAACDDGLVCENGTCVEIGAMCGNGVIEGSEQCDAGIGNADTGACKTDCTAQVCGDGFVGPGEACDDGNQVEDDACTSSCAPVTCGDGAYQVGEECDDGNDVPDDVCTNACTLPACGDAIVQMGADEECDDGAANANNGDCTLACLAAFCGDGLVHDQGEGTEECDDGAGANGAGKSCKADCSTNVCGDGDVGPQEGCDDGNVDPGDGCSTACVPEGCGDGVTQPGEACDDANDENDDECTNLCTLPACGDGFLQAGAGEACDDGGANSNNAACTLGCQVASCGDGLVFDTGAGTEECDDGSEDNGPGESCKADCTLNVCGDMDVGPAEGCDDGNVVSGDGCSGSCIAESCGDGVEQPSEECDDGNGMNDDACTTLCQLPTCGDGFVQPGAGEACDDGNGFNDDSCTIACEPPSCGDGFVQASAGEDCDDADVDDGDACTTACENAACGDAHLYLGVESCDDGNGVAGDGCSACKYDAVAVVATWWSTCAIVGAGDVKCWGLAESGQLGLGNTANRGDMAGEMNANLPLVALGAGRTAKALSGGMHHICARLDDDSVKCWGNNAYGQLGLGNTASRGDMAGEMGDALPVVSLGAGKAAAAVAAGGSSGWAHTCAILNDASVKCWGDNAWGQLGLGDTADRGDGPGEMGDALPTVALGTGRTAKAIDVGGAHACVILDTDDVKCWGYNAQGHLGLGDTMPRGDNAGEMGDGLPTVNLGTGRTAKQVVSLGGYNCAVLDDDTVKCWGQNYFGALGLGDGFHRGDQPGEMGDNLPTVDLGAGVSVVALSPGMTGTVCALLDDDTLKCWGGNASGQLGLGDTNDRGDEPNEMGANLPTVPLGTGQHPTAVACGNGHCGAIVNLGRIKVWGFNDYGQLGQGDTVKRGDGPGEMGDVLLPVGL